MVIIPALWQFWFAIQSTRVGDFIDRLYPKIKLCPAVRIWLQTFKNIYNLKTITTSNGSLFKWLPEHLFSYPMRLCTNGERRKWTVSWWDVFRRRKEESRLLLDMRASWISSSLVVEERLPCHEAPYSGLRLGHQILWLVVSGASDWQSRSKFVDVTTATHSSSLFYHHLLLFSPLQKKQQT